MGCKVHPLVRRNLTQWLKLLQYFLFQSFSILSICIYHQVCKPSAGCLFLLELIDSPPPQGYWFRSSVIHLPAMCGALHCCSPLPMPTHSWTALPKRSLGGSVTFQTWKGFFWWALTCPTVTRPLNSQSDFHKAAPHAGTPLIVQVSIAHLPDHTATPWAAAQE